MKNEAEEKAIAFVKELQREELTNSNHSGFYILPQLLGVAHKSFMVGYNEAMRWRDPKVELPEIGKSVLVKYKTAKNVEKHGIGKYFNLGIGNHWTIEGSISREVIGWRPIE